MSYSFFGSVFGFGEQSLEEIDKKIATYQQHIVDLKRIIKVGSEAGKEVAKIKLRDTQKKLQTALVLRQGTA
jgi:hypothetical protein